MDITNPRRILALGAPDAGVLTLLKDLTGSAPEPVDTTTAGLSHTWTLKTQYYTAELPIWIDEIADREAWRVEFMKPEAKEVVSSLGAWIFCFRKPVGREEMDVVEDSIRAIAGVIRKACGYGWDGTCLAIGMPQGVTPHLWLEDEEWEEFCRELGFEYVDAAGKGRNEFGEATGIDRVREALETTEWEGADDDLEDRLGEEDVGDVDENGEGGWGTFSAEEAEMNMELMGMKSAIHGGDMGDEDDEALQVEELERMMGKLQAIKDTSSSMPEAERKRFAAKAVAEVMKTL